MNQLATEYAANLRGAIFSPCGRYRYVLWRRFPDPPAATGDLFREVAVTERDGVRMTYEEPVEPPARSGLLAAVMARDGHTVDLRPQVVIGLNPSTADANLDDPTIARCTKRARAYRAGGLIMLNAYAFKATNPDELLVADDPVGERCDELLFDGIQMAREVIVAWGSTVEQWTARRHAARPAVKLWRSRIAAVELAAEAAKQRLLCLGTTASGAPRHPLYLPDGAQPRIWAPPARS